MINIICKELKMCLHKLSIVNETLEVLGTLKDYRWLYKMTVRAIIIWIVLCCLSDTLDIFWLNCNYFSVTRMLVPIVGKYIHQINLLISIVWGIILRSVYIIFYSIKLLQNRQFLIKMFLKMSIYFFS